MARLRRGRRASASCLAWSWYAKGDGRDARRSSRRAFPGVYRAVSNKYFVDELYDAVFVEGARARGAAALLWEVDATVVDGIAERRRAHVTVGVSWLASLFDQYVVDGARQRRRPTRSRPASGVFRPAQTGRVQNYALVMGGGPLLPRGGVSGVSMRSR